MRITQSISLSNIKTVSFFSRKPALRRWETCQTSLERLLACFQIGVSLNQSTKLGGDQETVNEFWWS
jgi:hypothetical protein